MESKTMSYLRLLLVFSLWGSLYVVSKFVLGRVPPFTVSFIRFLIAGTILYVYLQRKRPKKVDPKDYKYFLYIGFFGYFISNVSLLIGTKLSSASIASLINSMSPITIMVSAAIFLKEKLTWKKVISITIALIGVYIIMGGVSGRAQFTGILITIFSLLLWTSVTIIIRKISQKYDSLQITAYTMLIAVLFTMPAAVYEMIDTENIDFSWPSILSIIYMGTFCSAVAHYFWNKSLSKLEASTCSLLYPVQPLTSAILGVIFLGERITVSFVFGAILIVLGLFFSLLNKREPASLK